MMARLVVITLTPVSVTATQCNPQHLSVFSQAQPFQQGIAHPCGIGRVKTESECHDHRQGIHIRIITVGQPDAPFHLARLQHSAFVHGSDDGTECRGDYIEQPYQLHFVHPHVGGIGRYGNPATPVHRDYQPFHIPATLILPNDLLSLSPSIVRSLSSFSTVICRLGKQRLSALQR